MRPSGRATPASSARGRASGTRVGRPRREIMQRGLKTVDSEVGLLVLNALVSGRAMVFGTHRQPPRRPRTHRRYLQAILDGERDAVAPSRELGTAPCSAPLARWGASSPAVNSTPT